MSDAMNNHIGKLLLFHLILFGQGVAVSLCRVVRELREAQSSNDRLGNKLSESKNEALGQQSQVCSRKHVHVVSCRGYP